MLQQQWRRTGHVQNKLLTGSGRGVNGTRLRQWGLQGYTQVWQIPGIYRSINLLMRARRNLHFDPPSLATVHLRASSHVDPSYHSLRTTAAVAITTYAAVAYSYTWPDQYYGTTMDGLVKQVEGRLSIVPCVWFYIAGRGRLSTVPLFGFLWQRGGTALYRPLRSVLYGRGGDGSLPSPVFGYIYSRGRGQLSTVPCVRFI